MVLLLRLDFLREDRVNSLGVAGLSLEILVIGAACFGVGRTGAVVVFFGKGRAGGAMTSGDSVKLLMCLRGGKTGDI